MYVHVTAHVDRLATQCASHSHFLCRLFEEDPCVHLLLVAVLFGSHARCSYKDSIKPFTCRKTSPTLLRSYSSYSRAGQRKNLSLATSDPSNLPKNLSLSSDLLRS